ncbi:MAG: HD domain-containing phosphohydrolase [Candidatus Omnitrophota bacterium]
MSDHFVDLSILDLDWIAKILDSDLNIEHLARGVVQFLKRRIPAKRAVLFLWDEEKRKFMPQDCSDPEKISAKYKAQGKAFLNSMELNEAVFLKNSVLIPLRARDKSLGVVLFDDLTFSSAAFRYKEELSLLTKMVGIVLTNARVFINSERLSKDLFKFNVLHRALNPTLDEKTIVKIIYESISGVIKFDIFTLLILGKQSNRLYIKSRLPLNRNYLKGLNKLIDELVYSLTRTNLKAKSLVEDIDLPKTQAKGFKIASSLHAPLITKDKIIGIINLGSLKKNIFSARDQQNISMLASQTAVTFENITLYDDLQRTYFSIVKALTSAIEAKDPYTQGHSVLVSRYAEAIAQGMGLSSTIVESIKIAGLLHDLGKIGVPEEILLKMGKLTYGEYEVVKAHPEIALKILGAVEFPHFVEDEKSLEAVPGLTLNLFEPADLSEEVKLMIYHHHERYSGGGYPKGLKTDEIPLGARIMAVADTFEALTASRPYRKAFSEEEAKKILIKACGEQLDPKIVKVFIKILKEKGLEALKS